MRGISLLFAGRRSYALSVGVVCQAAYLGRMLTVSLMPMLSVVERVLGFVGMSACGGMIVLVGISALAGIRGIALLQAGRRRYRGGKGMLLVAYLLVGMRAGYSIPMVRFIGRIVLCRRVLRKLAVFLSADVAYGLGATGRLAAAMLMLLLRAVILLFGLGLQVLRFGLFGLNELHSLIDQLFSVTSSKAKYKAKDRYEASRSPVYFFFHILPLLCFFI